MGINPIKFIKTVCDVLHISVVVLICDVERKSVKPSVKPIEKGENSMSDAIAMVGGYAFFFGVYVPVMVAYVSGGFKKAYNEMFNPVYPGAPNHVKYGEADDY